jgi:hypothetical protein
VFESRKRKEIENLLKRNMRIKTTPTKSRNRTPTKSSYYGGAGNANVGSAGYSNQPTNVFSNPKAGIDDNFEGFGRMAEDSYVDLPPPTFTPTKQGLQQRDIQHFYDQILTIEELLDLDTLVIPSYPPSAIGTPRPASGFTSHKVTPSKAVYTKAPFSYFSEVDSYLEKRPQEKIDFADLEEGLRKRIIRWDQIEFRKEVFDQLTNYNKF